MLDTLAQFPEQIQDALALTENIDTPAILKIDNILICGMGGSGIIGHIIARLFRDKLDVPVVVNKEYTVPKWVNKNTLAIFISYSGETEELIKALKHAAQKKCKIYCVSSGGKLRDICQEHSLPHITVPTGIAPRAALAYLLFPPIHIIQHLGLIKHSLESDIKETIEVITQLREKYRKETPSKDNLAKQLATNLHNTIPQVYGWDIYTPIARRWQTQFNENSKLIATAAFVPECNHNDIVGWSLNPESSQYFSCVLLREKNAESIFMSTRLDFMKTLFKDVAANVFEVHPEGKSRLAKMMSTTYLGDFTSCYLAILRKIDPTPVDIITELKNRLASL